MSDTENTHLLQVRISADLKRRITVWQAKRALAGDVVSQSEAVRRLLESALDNGDTK